MNWYINKLSYLFKSYKLIVAQISPIYRSILFFVPNQKYSHSDVELGQSHVYWSKPGIKTDREAEKNPNDLKGKFKKKEEILFAQV